MSAHALNDPHRRIVIQDELESFFHVLLYYAVRFLPHNLADQKVGRFLYEYFDGFSPDDEGYRCGQVKLNAMVNGVIGIRTYHGEKDPTRTYLKFLWPAPKPSPSAAFEECSPSPAPRSSPCPAGCASSSGSGVSLGRSPSPSFEAIYGSDLTSLPSDDSTNEEPKTPQREHPLNMIISKLLSWFKGYYSLDSKPSRAPSPTELDLAPRISKKTQKILEEIECADEEYGLSAEQQLDESDTESQSSDEGVEKLAKLAKKLESHWPFINLLAESFKRKWPENDKGVDKKPKGGYAPPKSAVPSDSTRTSSKRRSMDHEPDDQPGPSKRSKT